jgi:membrane protease YdiL (CAAX protease family)
MVKNIFEGNYNYWFIIFILLASVAMYWLVGIGLQAGVLYLLLFVMGIVLIVLIKFFLNEKSSEYGFHFPVNRSNLGANVLFWAGFIILTLMAIFSDVSGANFYDTRVLNPLATFSIAGGDSFQQLTASFSSFWNLMVTGVAAPVFEEIILGPVFITMFSLLFVVVNNSLGLNLKGRTKELVQFGFAVLGSVLLFAALHFFNSSYLNPDGTLNMTLFLSAAIFRLILNVLMYPVIMGNLALGLMFGIGVHMANNFYAMGYVNVVDGLFTTGGIFLLVVFGLMIAQLITRWGDISFGEVFQVDD